MNPALYQLLVTYYRGRRTTLLVLVAICLPLFFFAVGWGVSNLVDDPPAWRCPRKNRAAFARCADAYDSDIVAKMGAFSLIPGLVILFSGISLWPLRDLDHAPLVRVFTSRREEVAWIFPRRTSVRRYGVEVRRIHTVVVGLTNRKQLPITVKSEEDAQEAVRLMAAEAPRAARGYTPEIEASFRRDPASVLSTRPTPPTAPVVATPPPPSVRMVAAPDCPFSRIDTGVRYLGLALTPGLPPPAAGEPLSATWTGRGARVAYTFDPQVALRVLEFSGTDPDRLRTELSNVVGVPALGADQVLSMLAGADARAALLGVLAAEALGTGEARKTYRDAVARLAGHADAAVAQAAQRVSRAWA
jgi:hypothetical protein